MSPGRSRAASLPLFVGLVAAIWAIAIAAAVGIGRNPPTGEEARIGTHFARGDGFRSPVDAASTAPPSAWTAPVYPAVIGTTYRIFGVESHAALVVLLVINAVSFGLIAAALAELAILLFASPVPGVIGAVLLALNPLFYAGNFWDGLVALAAFAWLVVITIRTEVRGAEVGTFAAIGGIMGLVALTNPAYALTFPVLAVVLAAGLGRQRARRLAAIALALAIVVGPWTLRDYAAFGRVIVVRTGLGVQFWLGNMPGASGWLDRRAYSHHPFVNPDERAALLAEGEPAYDAQAMSAFLETAGRSPLDYVLNCARRAGYLLVGNPADDVSSPASATLRWTAVLSSAGLAAIAFAGMLIAARLRLRQFLLPVLVLALAAPFIATAVIDRYRLPLEWLLAFYAGFTIWTVVQRVRTATMATSNRRR